MPTYLCHSTCCYEEAALHLQEEGLTIEPDTICCLHVHDKRGIAESLYIQTLTTCEAGHIFERNITTLENGNHKPAIHFVRVTRQKLMLWIGPYISTLLFLMSLQLCQFSISYEILSMITF